MSDENTRVFVDTNILIPTYHSDFYNKELYCANGKITNANIDVDALTSLVDSTRKSKEKIAPIEDLSVTLGVREQSKYFIDKVKEQIGNRKQSYLFAANNYLLSEGVRNTNELVYEGLLAYSDELSSVESLMNEKKYKPIVGDWEIIYYKFIQAVGQFFDVSKDNHNFDYGTDENIIVACLHNNMTKGRNVSVISNDNDVSNYLSVVTALMHNSKSILSREPHFKNFFENPIKKYRSVDDCIEQKNEENLLSKGRRMLYDQSPRDVTGDTAAQIKKDYYGKVREWTKVWEVLVKKLTDSFSELEE